MTCVTLRMSLPAGAGLGLQHDTCLVALLGPRCSRGSPFTAEMCPGALVLEEDPELSVFPVLGRNCHSDPFSLKETDVTWWVQTSQVLEALDETLRDFFPPETWFCLQDEKLGCEHHQLMLDPKTSL